MTNDASNPPRSLDADSVKEALSDPSTRRVVVVCSDEERSVKEISEQADIPLASTYRYVRELVEAGILVRTRSAISPEGKRYDLYRSRIQRAALEVDADGVDVTWSVDEEVERRLARIWDELRG